MADNAKPKPVVKIDSGAKPITPPKSMKGSVDSGKYSWSDNAWKSREGQDAYGRPTFNNGAPVNPIQVHSGTGVLGGAHMGGNSDVMGIANTIAGVGIMKTPVMKPGTTKNK